MNDVVNRRDRGITLIALIVTIVVLIILATISINAVFGENGIIGKAKQAKDMYENGQAEEDAAMQEMLDQMEEGITATIEGKTVKITKGNVKDYLGKVVSNYAPTTDTVTIGSKEYKVSTQYRLYYIDFDGKYGKPNEVYLKADCTSNNYSLPVTDTTSADEDNIKIKALNPALYAEGVTSPNASNINMKAVTFLTNTSNWDSLKTGVDLADKVNYVVGAPSLEMMFDSYNTKYSLTGDTPDTSELTADTDRVKLFYQYPYIGYNVRTRGYGVGPSRAEAAGNGYFYWTSDYSVKRDAEIGTMYYPGDNQNYWLASPAIYSSTYADGVMDVCSDRGGYVDRNTSGGNLAFCPLVSLQSTVSLELQ